MLVLQKGKKKEEEEEDCTGMAPCHLLLKSTKIINQINK